MSSSPVWRVWGERGAQGGAAGRRSPVASLRSPGTQHRTPPHRTPTATTTTRQDLLCCGHHPSPASVCDCASRTRSLGVSQVPAASSPVKAALRQNSASHVPALSEGAVNYVHESGRPPGPSGLGLPRARTLALFAEAGGNAFTQSAAQQVPCNAICPATPCHAKSSNRPPIPCSQAARSWSRC